MRIVNEIRLSQTQMLNTKTQLSLCKNGKRVKDSKSTISENKTDVSRAFDIATNSNKVKGANEFTEWGLQKQYGEPEEYKYSFPNSVHHVPGYLKRTAKQLKRSIKSPKASKIVKDAMTACEPWEQIAIKLKAMKGDVVKRQVGAGSNKPMIQRLARKLKKNLKKSEKDLKKSCKKTLKIIMK